VTNNRALSDQVSLLHSALETLSRASSCDFTLTSVADTLEKARQLREANPPLIPAEVFTSDEQSSSDDQQASTNETQEVTPDKPLDTTENDFKVAASTVTSPKETGTATTTPAEPNDGFMTPNRKHVSSTTASAPSAMEGSETSNAFDPLQLQSLGTTRGRNSSPRKVLSSSKRMKKKPKRNTAVMAVLDEKLAQANGRGSNEKHPGKDVITVPQLGQVANATAPLMGLRNDEEIQDNPVTGAAFDPQWQDAWGESDLDVDL
jgi:hypothetical protein